MEGGPPEPPHPAAASHPRAPELLEALAYLAPRPIPNELISAVAQGLPPAELDDVLSALAEVGAARLGEGFVALAPEVMAEARESLGEDSVRAAALRDQLAALFPTDPADPKAWAEAARLEPHVDFLASLRGLPIEGEALAGLLARASDYLRVRGELRRAEEIGRQALESTPADADPTLAARVDYALGRVLGARGYLGEAASLLAHARVAFAAVGAECARELRLATLALAEVRGELGEFEEALALAEESRSAGDPDRLDCIALRRIAWVAMERREMDAARDGYEAALASTAELLGPDHPDTAEALGELGAFLLELTEWEVAARHLSEALARALNVLGPRHPLVGVIRSNLATALEGTGQLPQARAEALEALRVGEKRLPAAHRSIWLRHRKLRRILRALGDPAGARRHAQEAARMSAEALGGLDPEHGADLIALAEHQLEDGEGAAAVESLEGAVDAFATGGPVHQHRLAEARLDLGRALVWVGYPADALEVLRAALADLEELGDDETLAAARAETVLALGALAEEEAEALEALGRAEDAAEARKRAAVRSEAILTDLLTGAGLGECFALARATRGGAPAIARSALERVEELAGEEKEPGTAAAAARAVGLAWQAFGIARRPLDAVEAGTAFERARSLLAAHPTEAAGVVLDLAGLAEARGDVGASEDLHSEAVGLFEHSAAAFEAARALLYWARARAEREEFDGAAELLARRLALLESLPEPEPRAIGITWHEIASLRRARGDLEGALEAYDAAEVAKREADAPDELAVTLALHGDALFSASRLEEARGLYEEALELVGSTESLGPGDEERVLQRLGDVHTGLGEPGLAAEALGRAAEIAREGDDPRHLAIVLLRLGRALQSAGDTEAALDLFSERVALLRSLPEREPRAEGIALHDLGEALRSRGDLSEAAEALREAADSALAVEEFEGAALSLDSLAAVQLEAEDTAAAEAAYAERLELLRSLPERRPTEEGKTLHELAELAAAAGEFERSLGLWEEAAEALRFDAPPIARAAALVAAAALRVRLGPNRNQRPTAAILDPAAAPQLRTEWIDPETAARVVPEISEAESILAGIEELDPALAASVGTIAYLAAASLPGPPPDPELRERAEAAVAAVLAMPGLPSARRRSAILFAAELGRFDLASEGLDRCAPDIEEEETQALLARLRAAADRLGRAEQAEEFARRRLKLIQAEPVASPVAQAAAQVELGHLARRSGEPAAAAEHYLEAARIRGEEERRGGQGVALFWAGLALRVTGDLEAGREAAESALKSLRFDETLGVLWELRALLAWASMVEGPVRDELLAEAEDLLSEAELEGDEAEDVGEVLAALRDGWSAGRAVDGQD